MKETTSPHPRRDGESVIEPPEDLVPSVAAPGAEPVGNLFELRLLGHFGEVAVWVVADAVIGRFVLVAVDDDGAVFAHERLNHLYSVLGAQRGACVLALALKHVFLAGLCLPSGNY